MLTALRKQHLQKRRREYRRISQQKVKDQERIKLISGYRRIHGQTTCAFCLQIDKIIIEYHSFCDLWNINHQYDQYTFEVNKLGNCMQCKTNTKNIIYGNFIVKYPNNNKKQTLFYQWNIRVIDIDYKIFTKFPLIGIVDDNPNSIIIDELLSMEIKEIEFDVIYKIGDILTLSLYHHDNIEQTIKLSLNNQYHKSKTIIRNMYACRLVVCFENSAGIQLQLM